MKRRQHDKHYTKNKKIIIGIIISFCILLAIYIGTSLYFINHFYFGTVINNVNASCKTVDEVTKEISSGINTYSLELVGRNNVKEKITSSDIDLKYNKNDKIKQLKDDQNPFGWIVSIFKKNNHEVPGIISYNKEKLDKCFNNLAYFDKKNIVNPKNASLKYTDNGYKIVDEVYGNKVNSSILYKDIEIALINREKTLNLENINCYENPKYTSKSQEVMDAKKTLDKYVSAKVTYKIGDNTEVVNGSLIHNWVGVNNNMKPFIDESKVRNYISGLANTYDTRGKTRNFASSTGKTVKVSGGSYGWAINIPEETSSLISIIKKGETVTKEPKYSQTAVSHGANDIGNTYVEIDLTRQHLWFYKNGSLVVQGDVVTGNESNKHGTPPGVYSLYYKERNATLKGQNYSTPVDYWMPFNNGIGIHDAKWRNKFGGDIYKTSGSHGCINSPHELAETIFNNISAGTPIVCYFE